MNELEMIQKEVEDAMKLANRLKGTPSERALHAYIVGIQYAVGALFGGSPKSVLPEGKDV